MPIDLFDCADVSIASLFTRKARETCMKPFFQSLSRAILFLAAMAILVYEFIVGPKHGQKPDSTIVIAAIGLAAASISLKWDWRP